MSQLADKETKTEDANTLEFGNLSETSLCLWNHQLEKLLKQRKEIGKELGNLKPWSKFDDVVTYVSKQPGFRSNEAAESARQLIESFNLEHKLALDLGQVPEHSYIERFEGAQLANLCITDVDEAFTLVPSLKDRFHDPKPLQLLLDKIQAYRP